MPASPEIIACEVPSQSASRPAARPRFSNHRAYAQTISATAVIRGLGVISGVLAARLLGPAGRGELAVILFLPMLLAPLGEIELPRSLAYEASRTPNPDPRVLSTGFWLALALGCVQALVLLFALPVFLPADKLYLLPAARWFGIYLPVFYVTDSLTGIDQGHGRFGRFSLFQVLPGATYVAAILLVWCAGVISPQSFAVGILAGAALALAARVGIDWRGILRATPGWRPVKRLLRRGASFYLPAIAGYALLRADMFLAVRLLPTVTIGLYAVAQAIAVGQIGAVLPFVQVGFSAVAGEAQHARALETLAYHFRMAQLMVLAVGAAAAVLAPWAIRTLFGPHFSGAAVPTLLLIGAMMCWGMGQVLDHGLRASSHPRAGAVSNLAGLALLVGLGIPACHRYGIVGLATAALAAQLTSLAFLLHFCTARLKIPPRSLWAFELTFLKAAYRSSAWAAREMPETYMPGKSLPSSPSV